MLTDHGVSCLGVAGGGGPLAGPAGGSPLPAVAHLDLLRIIASKYAKFRLDSIKCPQPVGVWFGFDQFKQKHYVGYQYCGKWTCPHCGNVKRARLLERINQGFKGYRVRLWTLTIRPGYYDDGKIMKAFHRLMSTLLFYGYNPRYVWFKQYTKNHIRHLHILITDENESDRSIHDVDINTLQSWWYKATEKTSWIVDTGKPTFDLQFPARYASRYFTRYSHVEFEHREHRFGCSRGFPKLDRAHHNWVLKLELI